MSAFSLPIGPAGVAELAPHAGAMRLIDQVDAVSPDVIVCSTMSHLSPDNPLRAGGMLPALAGIEYAAQAMALHAALTGGQRGRRGVLAIVSNVAWTGQRLDATDERLTVRATRLAQAGDGAQYTFELAFGLTPAVAGTLTVSLEPSSPDADPASF